MLNRPRYRLHLQVLMRSVTTEQAQETPAGSLGKPTLTLQSVLLYVCSDLSGLERWEYRCSCWSSYVLILTAPVRQGATQLAYKLQQQQQQHSATWKGSVYSNDWKSHGFCQGGATVSRCHGNSAGKVFTTRQPPGMTNEARVEVPKAAAPPMATWGRLQKSKSMPI